MFSPFLLIMHTSTPSNNYAGKISWNKAEFAVTSGLNFKNSNAVTGNFNQ